MVCDGFWQERQKPPESIPVGQWDCSVKTENPIGPSGEYRPHEFRNVPKGFEDWQGLSFPQPQQTFGQGVAVRISAYSQVVERKTEGSASDAEDWFFFDDSNLSAKINPHQSEVKPQDVRKEKKFGFAWEKKETELHGNWQCQRQWCHDNARFKEGAFKCLRQREVEAGRWVENCTATDQTRFKSKTDTEQQHHCYCDWIFRNNPDQRYHFSTVREGTQFTAMSMRFPVSTSAVRFRPGKEGQNMHEQEWYFYSQGKVFGETHRNVHFRSPATADGQGLCLVDLSPQMGARRPVLMMKCLDSFLMFDAREVWELPWQPQVKRLMTDEYIEHTEQHPVLTLGGGKDTNVVSYKDTDKVMSVSHRKCLNITSDKYDQACGINIKDESYSSRRLATDNFPCNAGHYKQPNEFFWDYNDPHPRVVLKIDHPYAYFKSVDIEFTDKVDEASISCYDDIEEMWIIVDTFQNEKVQQQELNIRYCTKFAIEILKYSSKCKIETEEEMLCAGITSFKLNVDQYKIDYQECDKGRGNLTQKFYQEPADAGNMGNSIAELIEQNEERSEINKDIRKFKSKLKLLQKLSNEFSMNFGTDLPNDKYAYQIQCSKSCDSLGKGDRLQTIYSELLDVKQRFGAPPGGDKLGQAECKKKAVHSCNQVKEVLKVDQNGFFWIKNKCSTQATKVYCQIKGTDVRGISVENNSKLLLADVTKEHNIKYPTEFIRACKHKGMDVAKITSVEDLKDLSLVSLMQRYSFDRKQAVLVGIDTSCFLSSCSGSWMSLDGSVLLNDIAVKFMELLGQQFTGYKSAELLVLRNGMLETSYLKSTIVSGVPCQTTHEHKFIYVTCDTKIHEFVEGDMFNSFQNFVCPPDCIDKLAPVYGTFIYSDKSNLCRAAIHSGEYEKLLDGYLMGNLSQTGKFVDNFTGSSKNEITSLELIEKGKMYTFGKIDEKCSIERDDALKQSSQSFLELKQAVNIDLDLNDDTNEIIVDNQMSGNMNNRGVVGDLKQSKQNNNDRNNNDYKYVGPKDIENKDFQKNQNKLVNLYNSSIRKSGNNTNIVDLQQNNQKSNILKIDPHANAKQLMDGYQNMNLIPNQQNIKSQSKNNQNIKFPGTGIKSGINRMIIKRKDNKIHNLNQNHKTNKQQYSINKQNQKEFRFKQNDQNPNSYIDEPFFNKLNDPHDKDFMSRNIIDLNKINETLDKAQDMQYQILNKDKIDGLRQKLFNQSTSNPDYLDHFQKVSGVLGSGKYGQRQNSYVKRYDDQELVEDFKFSDLEFKIDDELQKYSKFVDQDGETIKDFRSDQELHKATYYNENGEKFEDMPIQKFFVEDGDGTLLKDVKNLANGNNLMKIGNSQMNKWKELTEKQRSKLSINEESFNKQKEYADPSISALEELSFAGTMILTLANFEILSLQKSLSFFDDFINSQFKYVSISQYVNLPNSVPEPIPNYYSVEQVANSKDSSEESRFVQIEPDKVELQSDPQNDSDETGYGVLLLSKYHRTFDGSLHFAFKLPINEGVRSIFGVFFRYTDQFLNYSLRFNMAKKTVFLFRNNPFDQKIVWSTELDQLSEGIFIKVVIKFKQDSFKIWIHPDDNSSPSVSELDSENQKADFMYSNDSYKPNLIFDAGMKEGRIGWYCSHCKGLIIKQAVFQADKCLDKDVVNPFDYLISPVTVRWQEDFTFKFSVKYRMWNCDECIPKNDWLFKETDTQLRVLTHSAKIFNEVERKMPATIAQLKDEGRYQLFNKFKLTVTLKMHKDSKSGTMFVLIKVRDQLNQLGFGINHSNFTKKSKFYIFTCINGKYKEIIEEPFKSQDPKSETEFNFIVLDSTLTVLTNNSKLLITHSSPHIAHPFSVEEDGTGEGDGGTVGFGSNNIITEFQKISVQRTLDDEFTTMKEEINNKNEKIAEAKKADEFFEATNQALGELRSVSDGKDSLPYLPCLVTKGMPDRSKVCKEDLDSETKQCVDNFCPVCCQFLALSDKSIFECTNECLVGANSMRNLEEQFSSCQNFQGSAEEMLTPEKLEKCLLCVKDLNNVHVSEKGQYEAVAMCHSRFKSCSDNLGICESSWAKDDAQQ